MTFNTESIEFASQANDQLFELFFEIGSIKRNPQAIIFKLYQHTRNQLVDNLDDIETVKTILAGLRFSIRAILLNFFDEAIKIGERQVNKTLDLLGISLFYSDIVIPDEAVSQILSLVDFQRDLIIAMILSGEPEEDYILGGDDFFGALTPLPITKSIMNWSATLAGLVISQFFDELQSQEGADLYAFEAVAVIDKDTTQTCKNVDGQIVRQGQPFELSGQPRYADFMLKPPFHDFCRTTRAVVLIEDTILS